MPLESFFIILFSSYLKEVPIVSKHWLCKVYDSTELLL